MLPQSLYILLASLDLAFRRAAFSFALKQFVPAFLSPHSWHEQLGHTEQAFEVDALAQMKVGVDV